MNTAMIYIVLTVRMMLSARGWEHLDQCTDPKTPAWCWAPAITPRATLDLDEACEWAKAEGAELYWVNAIDTAGHLERGRCRAKNASFVPDGQP